MKSILEIVYDVISESGEAINNNQEYNKLSAKASEIYTVFDKSMSGGQKKNFLSYGMRKPVASMKPGLPILSTALRRV